MLAIIAGSCFSQIPNSGFENWTNMGTYDNPDQWGTMNNTTASSAIFTAIKGTPGSPGTFCIKLSSQSDSRSVINGIAVSGVLDSITLMPKSGFPFSIRPQSLKGNWQHMVYGASPGSVSSFLTKWNTALSKRDTVGIATQTLSGMAMSWAAFTINFTYQSGENPDTCTIILKSSGKTPTQNDYLWVDNLSFSGSVAGISDNSDQNIALNIFPNPANNEVEFSNSKNIHKGDILIISDMLGNEIFKKTMNENSFKINTSNFANGTYICKLVNSYSVQYSNSKFTIQH